MGSVRATIGDRILTGAVIAAGLWGLAGGVAMTLGFLLLDFGDIGTGWIGLPYWAPLGAAVAGLLMLSGATRRARMIPAKDGLAVNAVCWAVLTCVAGLIAWSVTDIIHGDDDGISVGVVVGWVLVGVLGLAAAQRTARLVGRYTRKETHVPG